MSNRLEPSTLNTLDKEVVLVLGGLERTVRFQHPVLMCMQFEAMNDFSDIFQAALWMAVDHG